MLASLSCAICSLFGGKLCQNSKIACLSPSWVVLDVCSRPSVQGKVSSKVVEPEVGKEISAYMKEMKLVWGKPASSDLMSEVLRQPSRLRSSWRILTVYMWMTHEQGTWLFCYGQIHVAVKMFARIQLITVGSQLQDLGNSSLASARQMKWILAKCAMYLTM